MSYSDYDIRGNKRVGDLKTYQSVLWTFTMEPSIIIDFPQLGSYIDNDSIALERIAFVLLDNSVKVISRYVEGDPEWATAVSSGILKECRVIKKDNSIGIVIALNAFFSNCFGTRASVIATELIYSICAYFQKVYNVIFVSDMGN